jgi:hypothetical protein
MYRKFVIGAIIAASLAIGGWTLAQQDTPAPKGPAPAGQFVVSAAGPSAVLLDSKSGKTWVLTHSVGGQSIWLPVRRIDSEDEARAWQEHEMKLKHVLAEKEKADKK